MCFLSKDFYFNAQVWGTVSDWVMIGVTAATAYYLYQTLQSQRETQDLQQKTTKSLRPLNMIILQQGHNQSGYSGT